MKLNMKAGERGIIVKSTAGNEGKIVQVLRLATAEELDAEVLLGRKAQCGLLIQY